jgi:hypothetical protein
MLGIRSQVLVGPKHGGVCEGVFGGVEALRSSKCKQ